MRLDWIEDVLAIMETGSLNEAAAKRFVTQPAFSRRVRSLEQILGIELLDRSRKPVRPTAALVEHQDRIREIAREVRALIADMKQRQSQERIVIASQHAITTSVAPEIVKALSARGTLVRLRSVNRDECNALLFTRQADLTLTYRLPGEEAMAGAEHTEHLLIGVDKFIPVYRATESERLISDFRSGSLPVIAYPAHVFLGEVQNTLIMPRLAASVRTISETALTLAAMQLSRTGAGLAWVPASLAASELSRGELRDLSETFPSVMLDLVASRVAGRRSAAEDEVWSILQRRSTR
jgi:DNA-binding transcriptional LysR family regulator